MKTANDNEKLDDYINNLVSKYPKENKLDFFFPTNTKRQLHMR